jgi:hypothetical protein
MEHSMIEKIIIALISGTLATLLTAAASSPRTYLKVVHARLTYALPMVLVAAWSWDFGVAAAWYAARIFVPPDRLAVARDAVAGLSIAPVPLALMSIVSLLYVWLLGWVSRLVVRRAK